MKRLAIFVVAAVLTAGSLFAEDFRFGIYGGGFFQLDLSELKAKKGGGAFINFDFTWAELGVSFVGESSGFGNAIALQGCVDNASGTLSSAGNNFINGLSSLGIGITVNGKFPFTLGNLSLFPLAGVRYDIMLGQIVNGDGGGTIDPAAIGTIVGDSLENFDLNNMYINLGGGLDFAITEHFFFREEIIWAFKIPNKYDLAFAKLDHGAYEAKDFFSSSTPTILLSIGFKI
ncbi:hypothetical protein FACS1894110_07770 [Spirochaetia bacterium]|nr:hypothetical protein FACS1894110_07770 [Spirochaetia bacterium]